MSVHIHRSRIMYTTTRIPPRLSSTRALKPARVCTALFPRTAAPNSPFCTRYYSTGKRKVHLASTAATSDHGQSHVLAKTASTVPAPRPLKKLPTRMLLRSLFIATISSHLFLLLPALSTLHFLTRPHTSKLLSVDKNPIIHGILKKTFYNQFCAGENESETRHCVQSLKDLGFKGVILTYARETVFDHKTQSAHALLGAQAEHSEVAETAVEDVCIREWEDGTLETVALVNSGDFVALKLTGAGTKVTSAFASGLEAPQQMMDALRRICTECKRRGVRIIIDAESQHFQKGISLTTLQLMREFNKDNEGAAIIYNTYQAYLKSTPAAIASHLLDARKKGFTLGLKLVRGAYMLSDNRSLIHDTKQDTDDAYNTIARGALQQEIGEFGGLSGKYPFPSVNLFVASHNRESVMGAYKLHRQRSEADLPTVPVSFGQLHGMSDDVSFGLLQEGEKDKHNNDHKRHSQESLSTERDHGGPEVFKCTTWGSMSECIAYLLRRTVENRDAVLRTKDEYYALRAEVWNRLFSRG